MAKKKSKKKISSTGLTIKRVGIAICAFALVLIVAGSIYAITSIKDGEVNVRQEMNTYLENKYKENFDVYDIKALSRGLGDRESWTARAHPVKNSKLVFTLNGGSTGYYDQYIGALWSTLQSSALSPIAENIFGTDSGVSVRAKIVITGELQKNATKVSPSFEEAVIKYPHDLLYRIVINSNGIGEGNAQKVFALIEKLREKGIKKIALDYYAGRETDEVDCTVEASILSGYVDSTNLENCINGRKG